VAARSKARKRALDVLFEAESGGVDALQTLREWTERADPPVPAYATELVEGVCRHRARIDELLSTYARDWRLDRMPAVDRNVLRIGVYEVVYQDSVPDAVAVDEAVRLARDLSTEQSPGFVNGVLGQLVRLKPTLTR
jgi:N utilization substance protein B